MQNRDSKRSKIPQAYKDICNEINRIEHILDHSCGEFRLYAINKQLKASIPSAYKLILRGSYHHGHYKLEYA